LLTLTLFGMPLDVIGIIGIILLIGIVKKNGIMLVDFALAGQRVRGLSSEDAIHEACRLRFRPIRFERDKAPKNADASEKRNESGRRGGNRVHLCTAPVRLRWFVQRRGSSWRCGMGQNAGRSRKCRKLLSSVSSLDR
jgi:hypothetical protein